MLRTLLPKLRCPACAPADCGLQLHDFDPVDARDAHHVANGVLVCYECRGTYVIEDELAEVVIPALQDTTARAHFGARFAGALAQAQISVTSGGGTQDDPSVAEQLAQRKHFDWYAQNDTQSYVTYQQTPFWRAADAQTVRRWNPRVKPGHWILDIGSADGRGGVYFADVPGVTLVGFDISRKMIANAIVRAKHTGMHSRTAFLVADATRPPFLCGTFDVVITFGVLHHLPAPRQSTRDIQTLLVPGGVHLAFENNESFARPVFDWLMKVLPLWSEEAGREPLISQAMVREWIAGLPVRFSVATSVFLPPHLFNWVGYRAADALLRTTDDVAHRLPVVRDQGGLIVFELEKDSRS